jgi:putative RecB family exonuclease
VDHLSCSQMNLYMQCSLKYKFLYVDKLPRPFKSSGLAFGSAFHSTLAWFHRKRMNGNDVPMETLFKIFDADWYAQKTGDEIRYKSGDSEMKFKAMARELLSLYVNHNNVKPMEAEMPFVIPLVNPLTGETLDVNFEGFIDLVEKNGAIDEFKTSSQTMNASEVDNHLQLTAYSYAYETLFQKPPKLLKLVDFVKTKKPKVVVLETTSDKLDYQRFFNLAREIRKGIRSRMFFPRQSFMCKDCEYAKPCKAWKGD